MISKTSLLPTFRELDIASRRRLLAELCALSEAELAAALDGGGLELATAEKMVENAVGTLALPFGIALNLVVNGVDHLVPMAIEEPSVIAAASHAAKRVRAGGGFFVTADAPLMAAQIEVHEVPDAAAAVRRIEGARTELLREANRALPGLVARGGGARDLEVRDLGGGFVVTHVLVNVCDAMGANLVNTVAEAVGDRIAELASGKLGLRILTNYCDRRVVRVTARVPVEGFGCARASGREAARGVVCASEFAARDPYRAVTHNKGIMNGVDAVVLATGNDWRAVEAAAHAYAARSGKYGPLATWRLLDGDTVLEGRLEMPLALGTVGGALRAHRGARLALEIVGTQTASELAMVAAAAGLATNLAALRALATEGIQRGHMALHHRAVSKANGEGHARADVAATPR
jgi:hydroxymethylglutaryl-CoA reductase